VAGRYRDRGGVLTGHTSWIHKFHATKYAVALLALFICALGSLVVVLSPLGSPLNDAVGYFILALFGVPYLLAPLIGVVAYYVASLLISARPGQQSS
jgi:hypothetical protein